MKSSCTRPLASQSILHCKKNTLSRMIDRSNDKLKLCENRESSTLRLSDCL